MKQSLPTILGAVAIAVGAATADAQIRTWSNPTNGQWTDAAQWTSSDVPDTATEVALFDVFGTYAVTFLDDDPDLTIGELRVPRGEVTLRADGVGDGRLTVSGDATLGGQVELADLAGTFLDLQVEGTLALEGGARLLADGGPLSAATTTIAGGTLTAITSLEIDGGTAATLGDVTLAATGDSLSRGALDLRNGSSASVNHLRVAADSPDTRGEVSLDGSNLTQADGFVTTIGRTTVEGSQGRGVVSITNGGTLSLAGLTVNPTGSVINESSTFQLNGPLDIAGGSYEERGIATRDFGAVATIAIRDSGSMVLAVTPLVRSAGQTLRLDDGSLTALGGLILDGGALVIGSAEPSVVIGPTRVSPTGSILVEPGADAIFFSNVDDAGGDLQVSEGASIWFADGYRGLGVAGGGAVLFGGDFEPGTSIGSSVFGGDVGWNSEARLIAELAGSDEGQYDTLDAGGFAQLAGSLVVEVLAGSAFAPAEGDAFTLLTADTIFGGFDSVTAPTLADGLAWQVVQTTDSLTLQVVSPGQPGDFNNDGTIDAADYTVWRDTRGSEGPLLAADANGDEIVDNLDYQTWRNAYSAATGVTIPEPPALLLLTAVAPLLSGAGGRKKVAPRCRRP